MIEVIIIPITVLAGFAVIVYIYVENIQYLQKSNHYKYIDEDLIFEERYYYDDTESLLDSEFDYDKYVEQNYTVWG